MTCFEIVLTTRTNEGIFFNLFVPPLNRSILFLDSKYIFCKPNDLKYWKNYCRSAKLYYQMMLSLSWTYSSLKLPNVSLHKNICRMENRRDCNPREPAWKDVRKCRSQLDAQIFISHELSVRNQV